MTSHIMPLDSVFVVIVQNCHACFRIPSTFLFSIVWLWLFNRSSKTPVVELTAFISWSHFGVTSTPEPSVDFLWLEIFSVTPTKITQSSWCPTVFNIVFLHRLLNKVNFLRSLHTNQVHASLSTEVSRIKPIQKEISRIFLQPSYVITNILQTVMNLPRGAELRIWQT